MSNTAIWGWDAANFEYVKALVDSLGHLQVDVLSSALPSGAATKAKQTDQLTKLNSIITHLAGGLPATLDGVNLRVKEASPITGFATKAKQTDQLTKLNSIITHLAGGLPAALDSLSLKVKEQSPITDYANYGQANIRNQLLSLSHTILNTRLPAALANDSLKIREQGTPGVHLYGFDGSDWQTLLVQSSTYHHLEVCINESGVLVAARIGGSDTRSDALGRLLVESYLTGYNGETWTRLQVQSSGYPHLEVCINESGQLVAARTGGADNRSNALVRLLVESFLMGFDGSTWDMLRTYATGILKVGRAEVGLLTARMTGTGQVGATGARKLYWMVLNPSAAESVIALADATASGQTVVLDHFDTARDGHIMTLDPPMEFSNGIYLETYTNMTSITFGYL